MTFKRITAALLALTMAFSGLSVSAAAAQAEKTVVSKQALIDGYAISGDWVYYKLSASTASIVRYDGEEENVKVPSAIDGYTITSIDGCSEIFESEYHTGVWAGAFESSGISSVEIPNTVTKIGDRAFHDCENLKSVEVGKKVTEIGEKAFGFNETGKVENFSITCNYASAAYKYALDNSLSYTLLDKGDISKCEVTLSTTAYQYKGVQCRPVVTVTDGDKVLELSKDYSYTYNNNNAIGTAYVKITGKGDYEGTLTKVYQILPANVTGMKAAATSANAVKLTWNKVTGADGYVVYLYNKSAKKWERYAKTTGGNNVQLVNKLNPGEAYAFTARAYKTANGKEKLSPSFTNFKTSTNPAKVSFSVTSKAKGSATYSWKKVTGATSYALYYKASLGASWKKVGTVNNRTTSFTKTGLRSGTGYFTVRAYKTYEGVTHGGSFETKTCKIK